ncbi:hypothetical protein [Mycobacterium sp.]|nr:hypothetical protein [Mycobacterium sp.]HZA12552.1 hypothetical protein [Mycobacterium sp.]
MTTRVQFGERDVALDTFVVCGSKVAAVNKMNHVIYALYGIDVVFVN